MVKIIIIEIPNFLQPMLPPGLKKITANLASSSGQYIYIYIYDNNIENINIDNDSDKNNEDNTDMIIMILEKNRNLRDQRKGRKVSIENEKKCKQADG